MTNKKSIAEAVQAVLKNKGVTTTVSDALTAVNTAFQSVSNSLVSGEGARVDSFGTFRVKDVPERQGRNPKTGDVIIIPAHKSVVFKAAEALKAAVNK